MSLNASCGDNAKLIQMLKPLTFNFLSFRERKSILKSAMKVGFDHSSEINVHKKKKMKAQVMFPECNTCLFVVSSASSFTQVLPNSLAHCGTSALTAARRLSQENLRQC